MTDESNHLIEQPQDEPSPMASAPEAAAPAGPEPTSPGEAAAAADLAAAADADAGRPAAAETAEPAAPQGEAATPAAPQPVAAEAPAELAPVTFEAAPGASAEPKPAEAETAATPPASEPSPALLGEWAAPVEWVAPLEPPAPSEAAAFAGADAGGQAAGAVAPAAVAPGPVEPVVVEVAEEVAPLVPEVILGGSLSEVSQAAPPESAAAPAAEVVAQVEIAESKAAAAETVEEPPKVEEKPPKVEEKPPKVEEPKSEKMDWYILKVQSNREDSIRDGLLRRVAIAGLERFFGDVIVPTEKVTEFKGGKKRVTKRKLYPGYLVVHMEINDDTWFMVRETPGIGDFTGAAGRPSPMLPHEVARILAKQEEKSEKAPKLKIGFSPGDQVKINEGTFENFEGEVESIDETNGRVTVMINIFGRSTPVELEYWQVGAV